MMTMMLVYCAKRWLKALVDEFGDWKPEGAEVRLSGITAKADDGFILLAWHQPIPERFLEKLKDDEDILDYVTYGASFEQARPA